MFSSAEKKSPWRAKPQGGFLVFMQEWSSQHKLRTITNVVIQIETYLSTEQVIYKKKSVVSHTATFIQSFYVNVWRFKGR